MGKNLSRLDDGVEFMCSNNDWLFLLEKAKRNDWVPNGTIKIGENGERDDSWDKNYNTNDGQLVSEDDAKNLYFSLNKILNNPNENLEEYNKELIIRFLDWITFDQNKIDCIVGFEIY